MTRGEPPPVRAPVAAAAPPTPRQLGLFALVALIWGLTWIPAKVGVERVPPLLFAAARGLCAGPLLLALHRARGGTLAVARPLRLRLALVGLLTFAATYGLLFWGVDRVSSGLAAVVHFSLTPAFLLLLGAALGEERLAAHKLGATALGVLGLVVLHAAELGAPEGGAALSGLAAIVLATFLYDLGVVTSRGLLRRLPATLVAGWSQLAGGLALLALVLAVDPRSLTELRALAEPAVLASLAFLVLLGSVVAFSIYLRLTHEWSPHAAGTYAFVSPAVAVLAGALLLGERASPAELAGMALLVGGTALALRPPRAARRGRPELAAQRPVVRR